MKPAVACVVLAGGLGTRLRTVVSEVPKCLAPARGQPFLQRLLLQLQLSGLSRFIVSSGYMADVMVQAIDKFPGGLVERLVAEPHPLGTGGAIQFAMRECGLDECIVVNGDTWLNGSLAALLPPLRIEAGELARLLAAEVPDRSRYGGLDTRSDLVSGFFEKGVFGPGLINAGAYRVSLAGIQACVGEESVFSLETKVLRALAQRSALTWSSYQGEFIDIGIPEDYRKFCDALGRD